MIVNSKMIFGLCFVVSLLVVALIHFYEIRLINDKFQAKYNAYEEQISYLKSRMIAQRKSMINIVKHIRSSSTKLAKYNKDGRLPVILVQTKDGVLGELGTMNSNNFKKEGMMFQKSVGSDINIMIKQSEDDFFEEAQKRCLVNISILLSDKQYSVCKKFSIYYLIPVLNLMFLLPVIMLILRELRVGRIKLRNANHASKHFNHLFYQAEIGELENDGQGDSITHETVAQIIDCFREDIKKKGLKVKYDIEKKVKEMLVNKLLFQRVILALVESFVKNIHTGGVSEIFVICIESSVVIKYQDNRYLSSSVKSKKESRIDVLNKEIGIIEVKHKEEGISYEILLEAKERVDMLNNVVKIDFQNKNE